MVSLLIRTNSFRKITSILCSLFFALLSSPAQEVLKINSIEQANDQIEDYIYIYVDTSNALDISQILKMKEQNIFSPLKQFKGKRSFRNTYWLYFSIENNLGDDFPIGLGFQPLLDHIVDLYIITDTIFHTKKTGYMAEHAENEEIIPFSNIVQIKNYKRAEIYLKITNVYNESPGFSIKLVDVSKAVRQNNLIMSFDGFVFGIMFLMIIYGLFLFFFKKDPLYLNYSVYIFLIAGWYFFITFYGYRLFPEVPRKLYPYANPFIFLAFIFYIQFLRLFIGTSKLMPGWDRYLKIIQIILVIESVRIPIFLYFFYTVIFNMWFQNIFGGILLISFSFLVIKLYSLKSRLTSIIAFGTSFLILGLLMGIILKLAINDNSFLSNKLGIILELLVFTYGITYRYALIEADKQKFQKQLIIQLEENAELHQKVNRELADKVRERTIELEQQRDIVISQKDHIQRINTEITDSIRYAKYIQASILPKADMLDSYLGEHFVLFKPKDIVSGDFYWTSKIDNIIIIAAADCTGHGVPGAFMSMLGTALLNEIINKEYITHPGVILRRLRKEVINSLQQKGERGEQKDGMDIALCSLDLENMKLQFAGANNPIYIIRESNQKKAGVLRCELPGDNCLYEIKGDMMPIGIFDRMENFTLHEINIYGGDSIYMFTDGYPDQFGGPLKKKYGYRQFREQLLKNCQATMTDQKKMLENSLTEWTGDGNQIDDILVVGFRVSQLIQ